MNCIYCETEIQSKVSREHVLPDFLGCPRKLPSGLVCVDCNQKFNQEIHLPFREIVHPILVKFGIINRKSGQLPSRTAELTVSGEKQKLIITKDGLSLCQPSVKKLPNGDYSIRAPTKKQYDSIVRNIKKKNPDFILKSESIERHSPPDSEEIILPLEPKILHRALAQFSFNCFAYWYGRQHLTIPEIVEMRKLAMNQEAKLAIELKLKKDLSLDDDVAPFLMADLFPQEFGSFIRINIFDVIASKIQISCKKDKKWFSVHSIERKIVSENK